MEVLKPVAACARLLLAAGAVLVLGGCESMIDVDGQEDRLQVGHEQRPGARAAAGLARAAVRRALQRRHRVGGGRDDQRRTAEDRRSDRADRHARTRASSAAATDRWLVVKATPEQAWNTIYQFWIDTGFAHRRRPAADRGDGDRLGREPRRPARRRRPRQLLGKFSEILYTTYKRDKFRTRVERGSEPGTVDIFVTHRGAEQMPTADERIVAGRVRLDGAAAEPGPRDRDPHPDDGALRRRREPWPAATVAQADGAPAGAGAEPVRLVKAADGTSVLEVDDSFSRSWRRVGLALDRIGFTVVDRDRTKGIYYVRYADPDTAKVEPGWWSKLQFWKDSTTEKPEQYQIVVAGRRDQEHGGGARYRRRTGSQRQRREDPLAHPRRS